MYNVSQSDGFAVQITASRQAPLPTFLLPLAELLRQSPGLYRNSGAILLAASRKKVLSVPPPFQTLALTHFETET